MNNKQICSVIAASRICCRAERLKLKKVSPIAANKSEKGAVTLITEKNIGSVLKSLARKLYDIINAKELRRFTSHSIHVGAVVALHTGGGNSDTIKTTKMEI
eukprot:10455016-Ditylum_brightwellii.AAC.1